MAEVFEDHVRNHVFAPALAVNERAEGAEDLMEVVRTYLK
jgi:hypothetical protein